MKPLLPALPGALWLSLAQQSSSPINFMTPINILLDVRKHTSNSANSVVHCVLQRALSLRALHGRWPKMCALTDFPPVSVRRSHHHPGESTEVPIQPPCRGCSFAAEETGQRCALWGLPASPLVLLGGTAPALFLLGWCSNGGLSPLSLLFSGWRGCWWWLSGMAGLGWRCHCTPLRSLPFALQGKVRNNCVFS